MIQHGFSDALKKKKLKKRINKGEKLLIFVVPSIQERTKLN